MKIGWHLQCALIICLFKFPLDVDRYSHSVQAYGRVLVCARSWVLNIFKNDLKNSNFIRSNPIANLPSTLYYVGNFFHNICIWMVVPRYEFSYALSMHMHVETFDHIQHTQNWTHFHVTWHAFSFGPWIWILHNKTWIYV